MKTVVDICTIIAPVFFKVFEAVIKESFTHIWLKGGRGSTKSSFISIAIVVGIMADPKANAVVYRKVANTLALSVYMQLIWAIHILGVDAYWRTTKSPLELIYLPTGQRILFRGADDPSKSKSIKVDKGYFKFLWFEELTEFYGMDEIRVIIQSVIRGGETAHIFYSYNPPKSAQNWVNAEVLQQRPDRLVHHSTYLDVPPEWLGEPFLNEARMLELTNETAYRHAYLGEVTGTGGQIFDNVLTKAITDAEINHFDKRYRGLDFGYTIDPTAYDAMFYHSPTRVLYIYNEYYKARASFDDIAGYIKGENPDRGMVIADSQEPRSIDELADRGVRIIGAKKGPDSVRHGIKWLQERASIVIDPARCPNAAREFLGYEHPLDRNGNFRADYPDKDNHTIDATRYALEDVMLGSRVSFA